MGEIPSPNGISYHQTKLPILRVGCIYSNCWANGSHGNSQRTHAIAYMFFTNRH